MNRKWAIALSDPHAGSEDGLMNPDVKLTKFNQDGEPVSFTPALTPNQETLWYDVFAPAMEQIAEITAGDDVAVILNGDPTQGGVFFEALVSSSQSIQVQIAISNLAPLLALPNVKALRMSASTQVHVYGESSADTSIAGFLRERYPNVDIRFVNHGVLNIDGVRIDYAHKGPSVGGRSWLRGDDARRYLKDQIMTHVLAKKQPPDLFLRAHYHEYIEERVRVGEYISHIIITPPLTMMGNYAKDRTRNKFMAQVGLVLTEIRDGALVWPPQEFIKTYDNRTKEAVLD